MTDAIKRADRQYAVFAARMLELLAKEERDMARFNATLYIGSANTSNETVRPSKG